MINREMILSDVSLLQLLFAISRIQNKILRKPQVDRLFDRGLSRPRIYLRLLSANWRASRYKKIQKKRRLNSQNLEFKRNLSLSIFASRV